MSAREQLNSYLKDLEKRIRLGTALRGAAVLISAALAATVALVLIINLFAFSRISLTGARLALLFTLGLCAAFGLGIPLLRLNRRWAARKAEGAFPQFEQRLITFAERDRDENEPFLELLAADTVAVTHQAEATSLVPNRALLASFGVGAASLAVLLWMILAGPGFLGYGAALLWAGPTKGVAPFYDIRVSPGDVTVRRNADELVTAQPIGLQTDRARLYARYQSTSKWEQLNMQPQPGGSGFQFVFAGLPESVEYYVEAGALRSRHFNIRVADLPSIKQIRVTYNFPAWTGLKTAVDEHGGDLRAIEGTDAGLEIVMDRPLRDGVLVLDDRTEIQLSGGEANVYKGSIRMEKDGAYHVAAVDQGQPVRLSEDFFIEASEAEPPNVAIARPGRDYQASPIEEVAVSVKADDQFGLNDLQLHYSVNGGAEQSINLLKQKGEKTADGSAMISLEDFHVVPGDIVSLYATAKNARAESRTDMFFIQAEPFEREFSQSQQSGGGGGGGGGGNQEEISQREKEIIAATWKQSSDTSSSQEKAAQNAKFLSGVQEKLREQALSLAGRLQMRDLTQENAEFSGFQQEMNAAAAAMGPASEKLQQRKWSDAMPNEQKALQHLLRAEATFRQIEVAFGNRGGGGAGGAGRDLASLFDLELDTQKNQYETKQTADSASQRNEEIDEALKKLDELARRQEELADQRRSDNGQSFEQRWQQEMLRRQAEELQRQIEQLAQNNPQGANSSDGQSSSGQPRASGSQSGSDTRAQQALDRLRQANDDMRRAASQQRNDADARRAADRLREAQNLLGGMQHQAASGRLDSMASEADRLSKEHSDQVDRTRRLFESQSSADSPDDPQRRYDEANKLADDRQRLADDLARLEKNMRDAERDLAPTNRPSASALRDALGQLDESDLQTRIQRGADRLRRGTYPDPNSGEAAISSELDRLDKQIRQAQQALGNGEQPNSESALDQVGRLRDRLESLDRAFGDRNAPGGQRGQQNQSAQAGREGGANGQLGPGGRVDDNGVYGGNRGGYAGGGRNNWWIDTGNNSTAGRKAAAPNTSPSSDDPERTYQQSLGDLNQLRESVQSDPETLREVEELIREMQRLDPKRFPGNPELVEQLHTQVLNDVDKLELQLQRAADGKQSGQVRSSDPLTVPSGYQDAVAEYFRRLSKNP